MAVYYTGGGGGGSSYSLGRERSQEQLGRPPRLPPHPAGLKRSPKGEARGGNNSRREPPRTRREARSRRRRS